MRCLPAAALAVAGAACIPGPQSALEAHGPAAARILTLGWIMTIAGGAISLLAIGLLCYAAWRPRPQPPSQAAEPPSRRAAEPPITTTDDRRSIRWILGGGVVLPVVVLIPLLVYTLWVLGYTGGHLPGTVTIDAVGKRWWWEFTYLGADSASHVVTANEIYVPVGERVEVLLRSDNVIHSFWVPGLQGKVDQIPGRTNRMWIEASSPGRYRGQCAEYCGVQHANMMFWVVAVEPDSFARWLENERRPAAPPRDSLAARGREVFMSRCAACHVVRGTEAAGRLGPDLTHVASRLTLASGMIPNTRGHRGGWIGDPQGIKPGSLMPRMPLDSDELLALLHYLDGLR